MSSMPPVRLYPSGNLIDFTQIADCLDHHRPVLGEDCSIVNPKSDRRSNPSLIASCLVSLCDSALWVCSSSSRSRALLGHCTIIRTRGSCRGFARSCDSWFGSFRRRVVAKTAYHRKQNDAKYDNKPSVK
jgi:hypothetical protein